MRKLFSAPPPIVLQVLLALSISNAALAMTTTASAAMELDGIRVEFSKRHGYLITVDGRPFSSGAQVSLTDSQWRVTYYALNQDPAFAPRLAENLQQITSPAGGFQTAVTLSIPQDSVAQATQTITLLPERKLQLALEVKPTTTTPVILENRTASIQEAWLSNRDTLLKTTDGATSHGHIRPWPSSADSQVNLLDPRFPEITIASPFGPLTIQTSGTAAFTLMDYRKNPWAGGQRYFWLGVVGTPLPPAGHRYELTLQFPPPLKVPAATSTAAPATKSGQSLYTYPAPQDRIIPSPQRVTWRQEDCVVGDTLRLHIASGFPGSQHGSAEIGRVTEYYAKRWKQKFGLNFQAINQASNSSATLQFRAPHHKPAETNEAYEIEITTATIQITATNSRGYRNALATIEQLFRPATATGQLSLRGASIQDFPVLPFRGVHFFTGRRSAATQQKMITEILAPLKINKLVYQVDYLNWDSQPATHHPLYGMKKADAKKVAETAAAAGIEIIPLINTFGHSEWLLQPPSMRHLADNPNDPYAYDPSNPEVYRVCEAIYDEAIALFQPRTIHIGHDEISMDGFPQKPENKALGVTRLMLDDIRHYYKFLAARGISTMIWGDMFLGPDESPDACLAPTIQEAERRREMLPRDIIIADWHYKPAPFQDYKSLSIFNRAGFPTIAATWDEPDNISNFAKTAASQHGQTTRSLGLLQTTWAGYNFDADSVKSSTNQYAAYVLAAAAAWSGGLISEDHLDYQGEFFRRWTQPDSSGNLTGWQINLSSLPALRLDSSAAARFSVAPTAFESLCPGENNFDGWQFLLPEKTNTAAAILTSAPVQLSGSWRASEVVFAIATADSAPSQANVGSITLETENGKSVITDLVYGTNIYSLGDTRQNLDAPIVWSSSGTKKGEGAANIRTLRIQIPGSTPIKSITLKPPAYGGELLLFAISGLTN